MTLLLLACADPAAPRLQLGDARAVTPAPIVAGVWDTDFGKDPAAELGPMGLFPDGDGVALLDQENSRILRYDADGAPRGAVPIPDRATLDAIRLDAGHLDAGHLDAGWATLAYEPMTTTWSARRLDETGRQTLEHLVSVEVPTGIFSLGDSLLVEQAHGLLYDVETGTSFPGRPVGDDRFVSAVKKSPREVTLTWSEADGADPRVVAIAADRGIGSVVSLEGRDGVTMLSLFLFDEGPAPAFEMIRPELRVLLLDEEGHRIDEISLLSGANTDMNRMLALGADRRLWQLATDSHGVEIRGMETR